MSATEVQNTPVPTSGDNANLERILSDDYMKNPLFQPTNKTAEEIVAEMMAEVSDEGVVSSLKRMGELHEELESKIKNYQSSFGEQMKGIQTDIEKYWELDREYAKYHTKLDELCADDGQKPASQQIKEMMEAFKEGKYKEGLEMVTPADPNAVNQAKNLTAGQNGLNQSLPAVSTEEIFSDASSEASVTEGKVKSPREKKSGEATTKGKKGTKKKAGVKS